MSTNPLSPIARALIVCHTVRKPRLFALAGLTTMLVAVTAQAQQVAFDIPGQSLSTALTEFGRQANIQVLYSPSVVENRRSTAVKGSMEPENAIASILGGTGISFSLQGNTLTLTLPGEGAALELGATHVTGAGLGANTEQTGSYTTGSMQTATKLPLSLRETPQSVTVLTRQRMDDQHMTNLNDVVKNTPGLILNKDAPQRQTYFSRGFEIDNIMYDGLPSSISTSYLSHDLLMADLAIYDRVEVVRGATGLMQGAGNPAAAINLVRKRPTKDTKVSITGSAGSWDRYRTEFDASGSLSESGNVRGRLVTVYQDNKSFQDKVDNERGLFYGIVEADLTDDTTLTLSASSLNDNNTNSWGGLPIATNGNDLNLSRSTYLGNDWEYWDKHSDTAFVGLEHNLNNGWKINASATKIWSRLNYLASYLYRSTTDDTSGYNQSTGDYSYVDDQSSYDLYTSGPFQLLGREHELVVGASQRKGMFDGHGGGITTATGLNIDTWSSSTVARPYPNKNAWFLTNEENQKSAYVTTRLSLADPLKLILGSRLDWYDFDGHSLYSDDAYKITRHVTKYAGLIYDLDDHHSVYVSYTDIFKPQNYLSADNKILKPIEGKNYEIGIKGEYFDGALNASAAIFQIDQENRAKATTCGAGLSSDLECYEASGKVRSKGIDLELQGAITPNWDIGAGYTFTESKYVKDDDPDNEGTLFDTSLPRHIFKVATTYHLQGDLERWRVGGNWYRQNTIYNNFTGTDGEQHRTEQKAYSVFDMMVGVKATEHIDAQLNLNNVFDKTYYSGISDPASTRTFYNYYGDPRNLTLTVRYDF
ncbi:MAG TPA: TonB-dependent siderophore receptor [Pseudomonas sp.]|uniref:TonB-dependent siderophore receptor n=1 Tax=Pseudomonas sp. TaxID=306 RepID=UPI002ED8B033